MSSSIIDQASVYIGHCEECKKIHFGHCDSVKKFRLVGLVNFCLKGEDSTEML